MRQLLLSSLMLGVLFGCSSAKPLAKTINTLKGPDHEMQFDLARASESDGQLDKAAAGYRGLCEDKPNVARYHQRHGVVLTRMGQRSEGLAELEHARKLEPNNTNILNDLGYAYLQSGEAEQAADLFKKTLEIDPRNKRANNNLALALGYDGNLKESFRILQSTMPESEALATLGYLAAQSGKTDIAVRAYSRALTLEPENKSAAEALTQLALLEHDINPTRDIADDLKSGNELLSEEPEEFPLNPASSTTQTKVPVGETTLRKTSLSPTTNINPSEKVLLSERDE